MDNNEAKEMLRLIATGNLLSNIVSNLIKEGVRSKVCKDTLRQWDSQKRVCRKSIKQLIKESKRKDSA